MFSTLTCGEWRIRTRLMTHEDGRFQRDETRREVFARNTHRNMLRISHRSNSGWTWFENHAHARGACALGVSAALDMHVSRSAYAVILCAKHWDVHMISVVLYSLDVPLIYGNKPKDISVHIFRAPARKICNQRMSVCTLNQLKVCGTSLMLTATMLWNNLFIGPTQR